MFLCVCSRCLCSWVSSESVCECVIKGFVRVCVSVSSRFGCVTSPLAHTYAHTVHKRDILKINPPGELKVSNFIIFTSLFHLLS